MKTSSSSGTSRASPRRRTDSSMPQTPEGVTDSEKASDGLPEAIILDVGHGNAAVFLDAGQALVVDAGPGDLVAGTLVDHDALEIVGLVISHRHHDHTSELPSLLSNPE